MASSTRSHGAALTNFLPLYKKYQRLRTNCAADRIFYRRNRIGIVGNCHTNRCARNGLLLTAHGSAHNFDDDYRALVSFRNS